MSIEACAEKVRASDPDRFLSAMTARPGRRDPLFVLYAFNLEVARAPWLTSEPMIAEMRLQFWRDAIDEIAGGKPPRAHEVAQPLSEVIRAHDLPPSEFHRLIDARRWDIGNEAFADQSELEDHLQSTAGSLMWLAALSLGAEPEAEETVREVGFAHGLANWLLAVPALEKAGRVPLVDGREAGVSALAAEGLQRFRAAKSRRFLVAPSAAPALRAAWLSELVLKTAFKRPALVAQGCLAPSEFRRRASLLVRSFGGRW